MVLMGTCVEANAPLSRYPTTQPSLISLLRVGEGGSNRKEVGWRIDLGILDAQGRDSLLQELITILFLD